MNALMNRIHGATFAATGLIRGEAVTYTRGIILAEISKAVRGQTDWSADQPESGAGVNIEERSVDWLIDAAALAAAGITGLPQRGDTVTDADGNIYRAMAFGNPDQVWRWHDRSQTVYRIFTKDRS